MNYYSFHIGDYKSHTSHLTLLEDLAYRRLLDLYYLSQAPLPDAERCARLIGMRDHIREVSDVLSEFFLKSDAGHINKRCDEEIAVYMEKAARAKKANESRWSGSKTVLKSETNQIPTNTNTNNQEPVTKEKTVSPPEGVSIEVWRDFLKLRSKLKAPITEIAMKGIQREADKAGYTLEQALTTCIERSWRGFNSEWVSSAKQSYQKGSNGIIAGAI